MTIYTPAYLRMALAFLFTMASYGAFFLFPLFVIEHGGSRTDIGIFMGVFMLSAVLCRPWVSGMVDRFGRKKSFTLGSSIMTLLPLSYVVFEGDLSRFYWPLLLARLVHGVGMAIIITAALTYIGDIVPPERLNEGIGMFGVTGLVGNAVGPAAAEAAMTHFGFHGLFICASLMAFIGWVAHLRIPDFHVRQGQAAPQSFLRLILRRKNAVVACFALLFGLGLAASGTYVTPYAKERALAFVSIYYIFYSSAAILTRVLGGRLADRVGEKQLIPYALLMAGAGYLVILFAEKTWMLALSGLVTGCGLGFLFPSVNALAIRDEPTENRGKVTGIFTGSVDAGAFSGSVVLGYIGDIAGFRALFLVSSLAFLAGWGAGQFGYRARTGLTRT